MTWLTVMEYLCHKWPRYVPLVVNTSWSFPLYDLIITVFVARLTRRVSLVEQELLTRREHMSSPPVYDGVRVTQSLVLCVCFVDRYLSIYPFFICPLFCLSFIDFRILITSLWYLLQTLLEQAFNLTFSKYCLFSRQKW